MTTSDSEFGGLPNPRRRLATLAILLSISTSTMDASAINVALPVIAEAMGVLPRDVTIVVGIYQLVIVACLFPIASLAEILGYRRVYLIGGALFVSGAGLNALAVNLDMLIATRVVQALGAACIMSVNLAVLRYVVPSNRLGRAIGINSMAVALSTTLGPAVAGWMLGFLPWNAVVMMGLPTGALGLILALFSLPDSERRPHRFDGRGAVLSAATFGFIFYSIMLVGRGGGAIFAAALMTVGVLTGLVLYRRLRGQAAPLVPLDLFRKRSFRLSALTSVCAFCAQMLAYIILPFALQIGMAFSPAQSGLLLSTWPLALLVVAPVAARLADSRLNGIAAAMGLSILALGMVLLATMPVESSPAAVCVRLAICGLGFGLFQTPNNRSLMGAAPRHRGSAASSSLGSARLLGQALGTAMATVGLALGPSGALHVLLIGAVLAGCGAVASILRSRVVDI